MKISSLKRSFHGEDLWQRLATIDTDTNPHAWCMYQMESAVHTRNISNSFTRVIVSTACRLWRPEWTSLSESIWSIIRSIEQDNSCGIITKLWIDAISYNHWMSRITYFEHFAYFSVDFLVDSIAIPFLFKSNHSLNQRTTKFFRNQCNYQLKRDQTFQCKSINSPALSQGIF